ncbi:Rne/Rng family ribonuclease [uncultured Bilophila sp.]|uniref:Rne/Rng family ribonuclease n=1 Tax=uncultured Bilophila sp. TaxID=529385 RepID=UPI0026703CED|nr:Rne/Rng family ribonuclease [uncultured Bilophila sp.]
MTDSEKTAAPAEQPAASEMPMSAAADAVETSSEPAPEKKPRRPRRKKPAVEQATLELAVPEDAAPVQPAEGQPVSDPAAEAPARKRPAPKPSAAKTSRKRAGQPKQPVEEPVEPKQPEQPLLTEHPVQIPAVAASVLPAEAVASAVPAVSEPAAVPAVASPEASVAADVSEASEGDAAAPAKRRRSRRSGRGRRRPAEGDAAVDAAVSEAGETPALDEPLAAESPAGAVAESAPAAEDGPAGAESGQEPAAAGEEAPRKPRSRSRRRKPARPAAEPSEEARKDQQAAAVPEDEVFVFDDDDDEEPAAAPAEAEGEEARTPRVPRKPRRRRNKKAAAAAAPQEAEGEAAEEGEEGQDAKKGRKPAKAAASGVDRKMLVSVLPGDMVEVVLTEDGSVREYYVEMTHQAKIRGNIYKGVINNIDTNLQAAFVNYGNVKNGFLQIDEVHPEYYLQPHEPTKGRKYPPIQKVLKPGQEVLVQVVKEPNGSKGAFLTTWLSLAGRFLVLTPGQEQIGISRKVEDGEERNRLRELIRGLEPGEGLGAIVRTVSAGTSKTTLQKDLSFLKRVWKDIRKRATTEKVPSLIYQEPGLASRSVRDYLSDDVSEVWVDDAETAEAIREMASLLFPRKGDLVHLYEKHDKTLWEHFGLLGQIEQVHSREVIMPSGGRLVFDQTEALMAIDINSGKIGGKTNFEAMAFRTNMEAAAAIARQLRLRDIGGQIVIDFIEMRDPEHCREVEKELRNAMKGDRARHDIGKMSSFGLLQIVRQRTGSSAISISMETCPHCKGTGQRRNMEWQSVQTLRELHRAMRGAAAAGQAEYVHSVDAELGLYLLNHKRERLSLMEKEFHIRLDIRIEGISSAPAAPAQQQGHQHNGQNNGR